MRSGSTSTRRRGAQVGQPCRASRPGLGGTITVATNTGGNATGGSITQAASTLLDAGTGTVSLTTPAAGASGIGAAGSPVTTTAGTVTATAGSGGVFITETDGANFSAIAAGAGPINLRSGGALTVAGPITSGTGNYRLDGLEHRAERQRDDGRRWERQRHSDRGRDHHGRWDGCDRRGHRQCRLPGARHHHAGAALRPRRRGSQ